MPVRSSRRLALANFMAYISWTLSCAPFRNAGGLTSGYENQRETRTRNLVLDHDPVEETPRGPISR